MSSKEMEALEEKDIQVIRIDLGHAGLVAEVMSEVLHYILSSANYPSIPNASKCSHGPLVAQTGVIRYYGRKEMFS